ncbi:MAG: aspartate-semialdehyde dehydrogenase [Lachnospiraceae bacterium]
MEQKLKVGILGATGMVGQRFLTLLENHPWFEVVVVAASEKNRGKTYEEAVNGRWKMDMDIPESVKKQKLMVVEEVDQIAPLVDLVFSAVDMGKEEIRKFEEAYAKAEVVVMSNNSAHRWTADVPMLIPEVNPSHLEVIASQKKRLGTKRGFIAVKPNCSIQSYAPALYALNQFGPTRVVVTTYQAISGSGKNFETWPQMVGNVIPYIGGEEEKSEKEPLKLFGKVENGVIVSAVQPQITSQCVRVPVLNGHTAAVFVDFLKKPTKEEIIRCWREFSGLPQEKKLPHAPKQFLHYFDEEDRPQVALDVDYEGGMGITLGRLREDTLFDYKFIGLSHNTLRGAAGGGVLSAELLYSLGYLAK